MSAEATLSPDRLLLTITTTTPRGTNTATLGRPESEPWTDEDVALALRDTAPVSVLEPGQANTHRRWSLGRGWWLYGSVMTGPPTWWWPRVIVRKGVVVGWFRVAFAVHIKHHGAAR